MRANEFITETGEEYVTFRSGNLKLKISSHAYDRLWPKRIPNRVLNLGLSKLKYIEKELSTIEVGHSAWALDPTTGLSLAVRSLGNNSYKVTTSHYRRTYDTGDSPVIKLPIGDAITREEQQLDELDFMGMSQCTKDCSGHEAGYAWSKAHGGASAASWSPSFNKGAEIASLGY